MSSRLSEIFNSAIEEEEDESELISNQNIVEGTEDVSNSPPDNQNSGPPLSEGISIIKMKPFASTSWHQKFFENISSLSKVLKYVYKLQ